MSLKALLLACAFAVPGMLAVVGFAVSAARRAEGVTSRTQQEILALLEQVDADPEARLSTLMKKALGLLSKGHRKKLWSPQHYGEFLRALPKPTAHWHRQRIDNFGDFLLRTLQEGNLADAWFLARATELLRYLRHVVVVRDLRACARAPSGRGSLEKVLADEEARLETQLLQRLRSVYWQLGGCLRVRLPRRSSGDKAPFSREERHLAEERAGFFLLQGRVEEARRAIFFQPVGPAGARRPEETPRDLLHAYRWLVELRGNDPEADEALSAERVRIVQLVPSGDLGLALRLVCTALEDLAGGRYRRAFLRTRRVLRELNCEEGPIVSLLARRAAALAVRAAAKEACALRVPSQNSALLSGERAVVLLIDAGRLYGHLGDTEGLATVVKQLTAFTNSRLAAYGVKLLHALRAKDRTSLRTLLEDPRSQHLLAREAWEAAAEGRAATHERQEALLEVARIWDALGRQDLLEGVLVALAESRRSEIHEAYRLYVESLYLVGRGLWDLACTKLEALHGLLQKLRERTSRPAPGLSLASVGPLYRLAWEKKSLWQERRSLRDEAERLVRQLFLSPGFEEDPENAFEAAIALVRAYAGCGKWREATQFLSLLTPRWQTQVEKEGPPPLLEREFVRLVDDLRAALEEVVAIFPTRASAGLFQTGEALLQHLRHLLNTEAAYSLQEAQLCEREAVRLRRLAENAASAAERARLLAAVQGLYKRAAESAERGDAEQGWIGRLYLQGGDPKRAEAFLREAMIRATGPDGGAKAAYLLGEALRTQGRLREALRVLARVTGWGESTSVSQAPPPRDRYLPEYFQAVFAQARSLLQLREYGRADRLFDHLYRTLREDNTLWQRSLYWRGHAALLQAAEQGDDRQVLARARALLEEFQRRFQEPIGVEEPPGSGIDLLDRAESDLAEALHREGRLSEALKALGTVAARLEARSEELPEAGRKFLVAAVVRRADIRYELGRFTEALRLYQKASRLARGSAVSVWAYFRLAKCAASLGRLSEARAYLQHGREVVRQLPPAELGSTFPDPARWRAMWEKRFQRAAEELRVSESGLGTSAQSGGTP